MKVNFSRRRDQLKIIADILSVAEKGATKTRIMYRSNLSYSMLERYLSILKERNLIRVENTKTPPRYFTTEAGRRFLRDYKKLERMVI
ncbi:MAG: winged helix-turn-helix domain-containing protein [Thermoproteota archaeon]